jgi:putative transposase
MARRITSQAGVTQVVKLRLDPTPAQVEVLRGYCGTARAVYNILLFRLRANLGQRAAERSYGIADGDLTPALSWQKYSLEKLLREHRDDWLPWWREVPWQVLDVPAHQLAVALARFKTGAGRFPTFKRKHGPGAGLVPVTFREKGTIWLTNGGRSVALPLPIARRRDLGGAASGRLSRVPAVKDNRGRKAAKLLRDGHAQVQTVTYSFSGGYWWAAVRLRVLPTHLTRSNRRVVPIRVAAVGVDAGLGKHFATLDTPVAGLTDLAGHIPAPRHLRRALADLAAAQRWLKRTTPGSVRHAKALARVQKLHGRTAGRRDSWQQHLAIGLTEHATVVAVEDLNLRGMARKSKASSAYRFGLSVADAGFGQFVETLIRQADKRGCTVVKAPRFYPSSKTCSGCGAGKTKLALSERTYTCVTCALALDRDVNAARNLAALAQPASLVASAQNGVSDAGEASSRQTPPPRGAAALGSATARQRPVKQRVPDPVCAVA